MVHGALTAAPGSFYEVLSIGSVVLYGDINMERGPPFGADGPDRTLLVYPHVADLDEKDRSATICEFTKQEIEVDGVWPRAAITEVVERLPCPSAKGSCGGRPSERRSILATSSSPHFLSISRR